MAKLKWDQQGEKLIEAGVDHVVLYPMNDAGTGYDNGVAWNGITAINENPGGADLTNLFADNIKYASLRAAETFGCTIEAYTYPPEWAECDGSKEAAGIGGVFVGQQGRKAFGLCYRTKVGSDTKPDMNAETADYKLHIIYNCTASPSSRGYTTINDNPDAISFSWDAESTPVAFATYTQYKATSVLTLDTSKMNSTEKSALATLEATLYGTDGNSATNPTLPSPDAVLTTMGATAPSP